MTPRLSILLHCNQVQETHLAKMLAISRKEVSVRHLDTAKDTLRSDMNSLNHVDKKM